MISLRPLREIVTFKGGGTPSKLVPEYWGGNIPWATVKDFTSTSLSATQEFITDKGLLNSSANLIPKGHVIIPTRMSLGKVAINTIDLAINQDLRALIPKIKIDNKYLLYAVLALKDKIIKKGSGATVKGITQEELYDLTIPLPPPDDQVRIAQLLSKVEMLIAKRKQHLQKLDDLLRSIFLDMFGDPVRNEKRWEKKPFSGLLTDIGSGKSPKCEARKAAEDEWGVLKLGAVTSCNYKETENKALPHNAIPAVRDEVKQGDLLFSRKNTYELVAACAYVFKTRPKLLMPDLIFRFLFKESAEINPIFIWKLLTAGSQRKKIQSLAAGAAGSMPNISKSNLKEVLLPIPPLPLQNEFAAITEKIEEIKSCYQQSLVGFEQLYGALSQKAFTGELDLSRVQLLPEEETRETHELQHKQSLPVLMGAQYPKAIELPDPVDTQTLHNAEGREALINQWLDAYLGQLDVGEPFSSTEFLDAAKMRMESLLEGESYTLGVGAYEQVKKLVFQALESGRLSQTYDDVGNRVQVSSARV